MRTGRLSISRGYRQGVADENPPPHLALVPPAAGPAPVPAPEPAAPSASSDLQLVNERLTAMERLVRLYEAGALTVEEFAAEKLLILGDLPRLAPVHFVPAAPRPQKRGPSLLGRILSWQFALLCLIAGIAFSFATQPEATSRFVTQLYRAITG
jgi:hypothetical protein